MPDPFEDLNTGAMQSMNMGGGTGSLSRTSGMLMSVKSVFKGIVSDLQKAVSLSAQIKANLNGVGDQGSGGTGSAQGLGLGLGRFSALTSGGQAIEAGAIGTMAVAKFGLAAGAIKYAQMPDAGKVMSWNRSLFSASLAGGLNANQVGNTAAALNGGRMLNSIDPGLTAATMAMRGYSLGNSTGRMMFNSAANLGYLTGNSAPAMAQMLSTQLMNPTQGTRLQMLGINNVSMKTGNTKSFNSQMDQLWSALGYNSIFNVKGKFSAAAFNKELASGNMMPNLEYYLPDQQMRDTAISYFQYRAMNGGKPQSMNGNAKKQINTSAGGKLLGESEASKYFGSETDMLLKFGDSATQGIAWGYNKGARQNDAMDPNSEINQALAKFKTGMEALSGTGYGQGILGAATLAISGLQDAANAAALALGAVAAASAARAAAAAAAAASGGTAAATGGVVATALAATKSVLPKALAVGMPASGGALAARGLLGAGVYYGMDKGGEWLNTNYGADQDSGWFRKGAATGSRVLFDAGKGALAGVTTAGVPGAVVGAIGGLVQGLWNAGSGQGWDYGTKGSVGVGGRGAGSKSKAGVQGNGVNAASSTALRSPGDAVSWAQGQVNHPEGSFDGLCDHFVARAFGLAHSGYKNAREHMAAAIQAGVFHEGDRKPPTGAMAFWDAGTHGHVAIVTGYENGEPMLASNDVRRSGRIDVVSLAEIDKWLGGHYRGWAPAYFQGKVGKTGDTGNTGSSSSSSNGESQSVESSLAGILSGSAGLQTSYSVSTSGVSFSGSTIGQNLSSGITGLPSYGSSAGSTGDISVTRSATAGKDGSAPSIGKILATGSQKAWATTMLGKIGAPVNQQTLYAMTTWMRYEGGHWNNRAHYNPLNTTQVMDGNDPSINSVGVKSYSNLAEGFAATLKTLNNGRYASILNAFRAGTNAHDMLKAVDYSPWRSGSKNDPGYAFSYRDGDSHKSGHKGYSGGAWAISRDHTARVHTGEMILPASLAQAVRDGAQKTMHSGGPGTSVVIHVTLTGTDADAMRFAKRVGQIVSGHADIKTIVST